MSTTRDTPSTVSEAPGSQRSPRNLRALGAEVDRRVLNLQRGYLANTSSGARATLAQLRNAATAEPGAVPAIWELTIAGLPGTPTSTTSAPTREERAAHTVLTLYATHQQSRTSAMHEPGTGFGQAVNLLAPKDDGRRDAVRRRFDAVATASSFAEAAHHLRGIVGQLRGASIPLDYGQLADDLVSLQNPRTSDSVRLRWARQYYRTTAAPTDDTSTTTKDA